MGNPTFFVYVAVFIIVCGVTHAASKFLCLRGIQSDNIAVVEKAKEDIFDLFHYILMMLLLFVGYISSPAPFVLDENGAYFQLIALAHSAAYLLYRFAEPLICKWWRGRKDPNSQVGDGQFLWHHALFSAVFVSMGFFGHYENIWMWFLLKQVSGVTYNARALAYHLHGEQGSLTWDVIHCISIVLFRIPVTFCVGVALVHIILAQKTFSLYWHVISPCFFAVSALFSFSFVLETFQWTFQHYNNEKEEEAEEETEEASENLGA